MIRQTVFGFKIEKTEEALTAHGGLALMAEFNHGLGLKGLVDRFLPAPGSNRGYAPSVYVDSLVLMLQAGGRHLEDLRELEREGVLMKLIGRDCIPDPDSVGDWLRRMGDSEKKGAGLLGLGSVRDAISRRILRRDGITEYTLDADATLVLAEKRDARMSYKGLSGYMPMLGFLFESGICLLDEFREGNASPGAGQLTFYRECKARMPEGKRIGYYRADSASYPAALINELESDGVRWAITADQDSAVKGVIRQIEESAWCEPVVGCGYQIAETIHTMNETKKAFWWPPHFLGYRLIVKRWEKAQGDLFEGQTEKYAYHAVASNWSEEQKCAKEVLGWHNQRGEAENFNKELKSGSGGRSIFEAIGMEQMPCGEAWANAVFFRIGVIAYDLREMVGGGTKTITYSSGSSGSRCPRPGSGTPLPRFDGSSFKWQVGSCDMRGR